MSAVYPSPDGATASDSAAAPSRSPASDRSSAPGPARQRGPGGLQRSSRAPARREPPAGPPPTRQRVRRTRVWMLLLLLTPVVLAAISLLTFATGGPSEPSVNARIVPARWNAITDADFGYAVPDSYTQNTAWTDQNGDFFYGVPRAFVAETLLVTKARPSTGTRPPPPFEDFGQPNPVPYAIHGGHAVHIPGTNFAWEETITRPGGYHAVALDTWERTSQTQMWLLVRAPTDVTRTVLASLQG